MYVHRDIIRYAISSLLIAILIGSVILSVAVLMILPSTTFIGRAIESIRSGIEGERLLRALILENGLVIENQGKDLVKILYLVLTYNNGTTKIVNVNTVLNPGESISINTNETEKLADINIVTEDNGRTSLVHPSIEYKVPLEIPKITGILFEEKGTNKSTSQSVKTNKENEEQGSYGTELAPSTEGSTASEESSLEEIVNKVEQSMNKTIETIENIIESINETIEEGLNLETIGEVISNIQQLVSNEVQNLIQNLSQSVPEVTEEKASWLVQLILKDLTELKRLITRLAYYDAKRYGESFEHRYDYIISKPWLKIVKLILADVLYKLLAIMAYDGDPSAVHKAVHDFKHEIDMFLHNRVEGLEVVKNVLEDTVNRISEKDVIPIVYDLIRYLLTKNRFLDNTKPEIVACSSSSCNICLDLYEQDKSIHIYSKMYLKVKKKLLWFEITLIDIDLTIDMRIGDTAGAKAYDHGSDITPMIVDKLIDIINDLEKFTDLLTAIGIDVSKIIDFLEHVKEYLEYLKTHEFAISATIPNKYAFMLMYLMHLYLDTVNKALSKYITEYKGYGLYDVYRMYIRTSSGLRSTISIYTKTKISIYLNNITYTEDLGKLCTIASLYCNKWFVNISVKNIETGKEYHASRSLREILSSQTIDLVTIIDEIGNYSLYIYINDAFSNIIDKRSLIVHEAIGNITIDSVVTELKRIQT